MSEKTPTRCWLQENLKPKFFANRANEPKHLLTMNRSSSS